MRLAPAKSLGHLAPLRLRSALPLLAGLRSMVPATECCQILVSVVLVVANVVALKLLGALAPGAIGEGSGAAEAIALEHMLAPLLPVGRQGASAV
jgi:hypothetical protein